MSPQAGFILLEKIMPLIGGAIGRGAVKSVGCEDQEELKAEGCAIAAVMLDRAERSGKALMPASIVFYALRSLRSGRRSGIGGAGRVDAMSPAAQLDGRVQLTSLDEPRGIPDDDPDGELTLHDLIADRHEDAGAEAGRRIDWDAALLTMDTRMQGILVGTAEGTSNQELAARYNIAAPRCCQVREAAGPKIAAVWGGNPVVDATRETAWIKHVLAYSQRRQCRAERAARCRGAA